MGKGRKLGHYNTAAEMRDIIERLVSRQLGQERPKPRYATVTTIDRTNRFCTVTFPGDSGAVKVAMGSIQPVAVGQTVRIAGVRGDRFIDDVLGPVAAMSSTRLQGTLGGIGQRLVTDSGTASWVGTLTAWGVRGPNYLTTGTINITFPANGSVITGVGGASNQTVAGAVINLAVGDALYYIPPWGTSGTSLDANFRIVGTTSNYDIPDDWILVVVRVTTYLFRWGTTEFDSEFYGTRSDNTTVNATITTGFGNGGSDVGVTVRWPPSGRGMILVGGRMKHVTAGEGVFSSYQIRDNDASGTVQIAASDTDAAYTESGSFQQMAYFSHVGSAILVPGNKYYIRSMVRATASVANATISARRIGFIPTD